MNTVAKFLSEPLLRIDLLTSLNHNIRVVDRDVRVVVGLSSCSWVLVSINPFVFLLEGLLVRECPPLEEQWHSSVQLQSIGELPFRSSILKSTSQTGSIYSGREGGYENWSLRSKNKQTNKKRDNNWFVTFVVRNEPKVMKKVIYWRKTMSSFKFFGVTWINTEETDLRHRKKWERKTLQPLELLMTGP